MSLMSNVFKKPQNNMEGTVYAWEGELSCHCGNIHLDAKESFVHSE